MPPFRLVLDLLDQLPQAPPPEELVGPIVQRAPVQRLGRVARRRHPKDLLQNLNVVRDRKQVPRVLVGEEVVELVEARPRDAAQAEAAGLVGGEEDAVPGLRPGAGAGARRGGGGGGGGGEEFLDAVNFAVEEGRDPLVVGGDGVRGQVGAAEDGGPEEFAASADALAGERHNALLGRGEEGL